MDPALDQLVRDARQWADGKGRPLDAAVLVVLLDLHLGRDGLGDAAWPAGSVRSLMTAHLPRRGPVEAPDARVVADTLDAYLRFLRTTGRMAGASAPLPVLLDEVRRSRRPLERALADEDSTARRRAVAAHRARLRALREPSPADGSAAAFRDSALFHDLSGVLDRLGAGVELVAGQLPMDVVHELYDALDLGAWLAQVDDVSAFVESAEDEVEAAEPRPWDDNWRAPEDVAPVDRLWWALVRTGHVAVEDDRAAVAAGLPADDEACRAAGVECLSALAEWFAWTSPLDALVMVLVLLDDPLAPVRTLDELVEAWLTEATARAHDLRQVVDREALTTWAGEAVAAIGAFDDCGLWVREGRELRGTPFGHDVAQVLAPPVEEE